MNRTDLSRDIRKNQELKAKTHPTVRIRLADESGKIYHWTIERASRTGWQFTDHDGYVRFVEGTWNDVIPRVRGTAENYGLKLMSALS